MQILFCRNGSLGGVWIAHNPYGPYLKTHISNPTIIQISLQFVFGSKTELTGIAQNGNMATHHKTHKETESHKQNGNISLFQFIFPLCHAHHKTQKETETHKLKSHPTLPTTPSSSKPSKQFTKDRSENPLLSKPDPFNAIKKTSPQPWLWVCVYVFDRWTWWSGSKEERKKEKEKERRKEKERKNQQKKKTIGCGVGLKKIKKGRSWWSCLKKQERKREKERKKEGKKGPTNLIFFTILSL